MFGGEGNLDSDGQLVEVLSGVVILSPGADKAVGIVTRARPELPHFRPRTPCCSKVLCVIERSVPSPVPSAASIAFR